MKLVIIIASISLALGYEEWYKGFSDCGVDGWSCTYEQGKYEVTYTCSASQPNARVWVWTARLPPGAATFIVKDCNHLEVHFDCTTGLRITILKEFKVINVTFLEILPPLLPGVFLHDNDQVPQAPPVLFISNVKKIKLYPGVFDEPAGKCRYKFLAITALTLEKVHIDRIMKDLFYDKNMNSVVLKDVVIDAIDNNAMTIAADTSISGTSFPFLPSNAITVRGENISFVNNTFKKIHSNGLTVKCKEFIFSHNHVEEINTQGLNVLGTKIQIFKNVFNHLETGALQNITPGYSPLTYEIAKKFSFRFSENLIQNINPGSFHINWEVYKEVCADIEFKNNTFECSCTNLGWLSVSNGLGPKISKVKEFYDIYLNNEYNACKGFNHCPLNEVIAQIQDVCNNKTNVSTICFSFAGATEAITGTSLDDLTLPLSNSTREITEEQRFRTDREEVTEKAIPVFSYTENQTSHIETGGLPVIFIVLPVLLILAAVSLGIFTWWYKKKRQRRMVTTAYKNERSADADNLIVINEHHNELYDKQ